MKGIYEILRRLKAEKISVGNFASRRPLTENFCGFFVFLGFSLVIFLKCGFPIKNSWGFDLSSQKKPVLAYPSVSETKGKLGEPASSQEALQHVSPMEKAEHQKSIISGLVPVSPELALLVMAEEARYRKEYEKALIYYRLYLEKHEDPDVLNNLGATLLTLGRDTEAVVVLTKAYRLKRDEAIALNLILAYWRIGAREEACRIVQENLDPSSQAQSIWRSLRLRLGCSLPEPVKENGP